VKKWNKIRPKALNKRIIDIGIGFLYENNYPELKLVFANPKKIVVDEEFGIAYYYNRENVVEVDNTTGLAKIKVLGDDEDEDKSWITLHVLKKFNITRNHGNTCVFDTGLKRSYINYENLSWFSGKVEVSFKNRCKLEISCEKSHVYAATEIALRYINHEFCNQDGFTINSDSIINDEVSLLYELFRTNKIIIELTEKDYYNSGAHIITYED
jgi:hypothetical protein